MKGMEYGKVTPRLCNTRELVEEHTVRFEFPQVRKNGEKAHIIGMAIIECRNSMAALGYSETDFTIDAAILKG